MPERNWDKELAKVDKQLASLSDEALLTPTDGKGKAEAGRGGKAVGGRNAAGAAGPAALSADTGDVRSGFPWGMYARLLLSVALGVGMVVWPYESRCGFGLAGYLAAVVVVITSGVWSAIWTWRHRASRSHTLSLLIILWGLILGAIEVLPRVGYGKPDLNHPAAWTCSALPPSVPPKPTPTVPSGSPPTVPPKTTPK
jgi:hypothetical protein